MDTHDTNFKTVLMLSKINPDILVYNHENDFINRIHSVIKNKLNRIKEEKWINGVKNYIDNNKKYDHIREEKDIIEMDRLLKEHKKTDEYKEAFESFSKNYTYQNDDDNTELIPETYIYYDESDNE